MFGSTGRLGACQSKWAGISYAWRAMGPGAEYYAENYADYERQTSPRKLAFYMEIVRTWVPRGSRLHELGTGMGHFLERACEDYLCSGSDVNAHGVVEAQRRAPRATLTEGSCEVIPASPPPQAVVAWDVLEHLPSLDAGLGTIHERLADGGLLIAVVPVYDGPLGRIVEWLDRDPTHVSKLGRRDWLGALERNGFETLAWGGILRRLVGGRWYLHLVWPRPLLRWIGSAVWIVARRRPVRAGRASVAR